MPTPEYRRSPIYAHPDNFDFLGNDLQKMLEVLTREKRYYEERTPPQQPAKTAFGFPSTTMYWNQEALRRMPAKFDMKTINATILEVNEGEQQTSLVLLMSDDKGIVMQRLTTTFALETSTFARMMREKGIKDKRRLSGQQISVYVVDKMHKVAIS